MVTHSSTENEVVRLINLLRADEGDSVEILCDNPDFNGQPNCAIVCCGDWTGWLHKRFAADALLDALSMAMVERNLPSPRKVIAKSNGHHWIERFNLVCCRDCGFIRRADDQNAPCKGVVGVGIRRDLLPASLTTASGEAATPSTVPICCYCDADLSCARCGMEQPSDAAQAGRDPATIEACAKIAEAQKETFLSPQYASNQPFGSLCERFACDEVAKAIRALAVSSHNSQTQGE